MPASNRLLLTAGLVTWALAGVPTIERAFGPRGSPHFPLWLAAFLVFGVAFALLAAGNRSPRAEVALLVVQSSSALVAVGFGSGRAAGFTGVLLAVVAGELPFVLPVGRAAAWVLAQSAILALLFALGADAPWLTLGGYVGFQLFALGAGHVAKREADARRELAATHAELVATQALLAESTRESERLRIARELHDSAGHHLTALSLQLELAKNAGAEEAKEAVLRARTLAGELLAEVRQVVHELRDTRHLELEPALAELTKAASGLDVKVSIAPGLELDSETTHALFRCAQEAITNALRHSNARAIALELVEEDGVAVLRIVDDGRGSARVEPGAGLSGIRERLELLGGHLELDTSPGGGFSLAAYAPLARGAQ